MSENQQEGPKSTDPSSRQSDTSPIMRSKTSHDGRPLQTIITEKAIHGAVPTEYALMKPSVWHSTQWQFEETLAAVRFSDGSTTYLQQGPIDEAMIQASKDAARRKQKPAIGSLEDDVGKALAESLGAGHDET